MGRGAKESRPGYSLDPGQDFNMTFKKKEKKKEKNTGKFNTQTNKQTSRRRRRSGAEKHRSQELRQQRCGTNGRTNLRRSTLSAGEHKHRLGETRLPQVRPGFGKKPTHHHHHRHPPTPQKTSPASRCLAPATSLSTCA